MSAVESVGGAPFATGPGRSPPLLAIRDLEVRFDTPSETVRAVNGISLSVFPGEIFAIVGESGSGKSVSMLSVMQLLEVPPAVVSGSIMFGQVELMGLRRRELNRIRGRDISMIFQDPMSSLNPVHPVGRQIVESLRIHRNMSRTAGRARAIELLDRVGIPAASTRVDDFPHEFSGGMRQRAMIAMALACDPQLLIADEPTTALDVTVQAQIVALVRELQAEFGMAVIWITHDLGVVAEIADRVAVMYAGRIMETGTAGSLYSGALHPYTSGLLRSIPKIDGPTASRLAEIPGAPMRVLEPLHACPFHDRCPRGDEDCVDALPDLVEASPGHHVACIHHRAESDGDLLWPDGPPIERAESGDGDVIVSVRDLEVHFPVHHGLGSRGDAVRAVDGVDLDVKRGRTLGVVGESGCGKTTLGRAMVGLVRATGGEVRVAGEPMSHKRQRRKRIVQMIFQDPFSAMNPGMRVEDVIAEPLRIHRIGTSEEIARRVDELLAQVGLPDDAGRRYPHEFSGGQRQRIAIARALAADPEVIVCDEAVSALDVSVQAQVVNLLRDLQAEKNLAYVFIAHDLAVVRHISDEVAVMYLGQVVEYAPRHALYDTPLHPYTKALLAAVPSPEPPGERAASAPAHAPLRGDIPDPSRPPSGCRFHTRCPVAVEGLCATETPPLLEVADDRWVACHLVKHIDTPTETAHVGTP